MSEAKNLFDDEAEGEYVPQAEQQQQEQYQYGDTQNLDGGQQNYAQPEEQKAQAQNNLFDDAGEEEYKPIEQQVPAPQAANPYGGEETGGHPVGFGAERANLMEEAPVSMDNVQSVNPSDKEEVTGGYEESKGNKAVDERLKAETEQAKSQFLSEINALHGQSAVANQELPEDVDQSSQVFKVSEPVQSGSTIKYKVTGQDSEGMFETQRRFNEFFALRKALYDRWPGCYIPYCPDKSVVNINTNKMQVKGNKDEKFVEERRALLERFLREIAQYDYLIESKEFKIFARGTGEVTDELNKLPPQAPIQILEKYRLNFKIDEDQPAAELARYKDKINIFQAFLKKAIVSLEKQKKEFKEYATAQDDSYNHYERIYAAFIKFEETAVDYYGDGDRNLRVMTHPSANDLINSIDETIKSWKNPFREAWIWIKGELLDVRGMMDAMNGRDQVIQKQLKTEERIRDKQKELDKMTLGKTTMKSFFKSKSTIEKDILNYQSTIEQMNVDVEDYRKLINFVTIYHGQLAIDKFKKAKLLQYQKMLNFFAVREIGNAHTSATLYHSILELNEKI